LRLAGGRVVGLICKNRGFGDVARQVIRLALFSGNLPMSAEVTTSSTVATAAPASLSKRRLSIGFLNWAHALDHFVILIYPTVVLELQVTYGQSYAELIGLSTASFVAFGLFSLPAGWLGDRWSRRNMMAAFYVGCGVSLVAAAFAPSLTMLAP